MRLTHTPATATTAAHHDIQEDTVRRLPTYLGTTVLVLACGVGCSSPTPDPKVPRAAPSSYTETSEPPPAAPPADAGPGSAPDDLHDLDWARLAVPGDFCDIPDPITFTDGEATAHSDTHGTVHAEHHPDDVVYGDVVGDSRTEAALLVGCDTGGQTASGRLAWAYVVFSSEEGRLRHVGTVTPQQYIGGQASSFVSVLLDPGQVIAHESWHRRTDATCCPSGSAVTVWRVDRDDPDGTLKPGLPRVIQ
ncbi:hypothetical protein GCM10010247_68230 [Streptomyces calvus]|nr:hypothetical protein GCM10010247_68230 [Streptomyces calvus]